MAITAIRNSVAWKVQSSVHCEPRRSGQNLRNTDDWLYHGLFYNQSPAVASREKAHILCTEAGRQSH